MFSDFDELSSSAGKGCLARFDKGREVLSAAQTECTLSSVSMTISATCGSAGLLGG